MLTTTNKVGEFIRVEHEPKDKLVNKYVDGMLRSSYPANSRKRALMIMKQQIQ